MTFSEIEQNIIFRIFDVEENKKYCKLCNQMKIQNHLLTENSFLLRRDHEFFSLPLILNFHILRKFLNLINFDKFVIR